jgi:hypothetical protein
MHTHPVADVVIRLVSLVWAFAMLLAGMWLAAGSAQLWAPIRLAALCAGIGLVAGAQVVFLAMVADRYFPRAHPVLVLVCELMAFAIFGVGIGCAAWLILTE